MIASVRTQTDAARTCGSGAKRVSSSRDRQGALSATHHSLSVVAHDAELNANALANGAIKSYSVVDDLQQPEMTRRPCRRAAESR